MHQLPRTLTLTLSSLTLALALGLFIPSPQPATALPPDVPAYATTSTDGPLNTSRATKILKTEHTDALALGITENTLEMYTYADLPGAPRTRLQPAETIFNIEDQPLTRVSLPSGFDFIGAEGQDIWLAPQTQAQGVLWPGWNTEDIRPGQLTDDALTLELIKAETPENGSLEVFQSSPFGTSRVFSSDEKLPAYRQAVGAHAHANWAFTAQGTYKLTFRASGTLLDGAAVSAEQTYTFTIGEVPTAPTAPENSKEAAPTPATPESPEDTAPDSSDQPAPSLTTTSAPALPPVTETKATLPPAPSNPHSEHQDTPLADSPQQAPEEHAPLPQQEETPRAVQGAPTPQQAPVAQTPPRQAPSTQQAPAAQKPKPQQPAPAQQCMATEELVQAVANTNKQSAANRASSHNSTAERLPHQPALSLVRAVNPTKDRAVNGHFDFGAVLNGASLSAQVKDDRTSPARWKQPNDLTFALGQEAKTTMPAGMEHIASAGSEVYLIGATQQDQVPWLGWNTQNPELVAQAAGPATLTLTDFQGPGRLSVFLSGNFGARGTTVFNQVGDSFSVPLNTHQHGNWIFTEQGVYTVTLTWSVPLKNGQKATASGTLHFEVGDASQGKNQKPEQQAEKKTDRGGDSEAINSETGVVTRPDGTKVRIVGKTAQGENCDLTAEQLASAQQRSARGELAYTGSNASTLLAGGLTALVLGTLLLLSKRRSPRRVSSHG